MWCLAAGEERRWGLLRVWASHGQQRMLHNHPDRLQRTSHSSPSTGNKTLLNEAWEAALRWPAATWRLVSPQQPDAPDAPGPRRGHSAVLLPGDGPPQMVRRGRRRRRCCCGANSAA